VAKPNNDVTHPFLCCWRHLANMAEWPNNFTASSKKYDVHTKYHGDLTCHFDVMVNALLQDDRIMTYTPYEYGAVVLRYYSTYPH